MTSYLVYFNDNELDTLFDATQWDKERVWSVLKGSESPRGPDIMRMIIDTQRLKALNYKLYDFESDMDSVTIIKKFHEDPIGIRELIAKTGTKLFDGQG